MNPEFIPAARVLVGEEERAAVDAVLMSGNLAQGPEVEAFEVEFSREMVDGRPAVAVNSGTAGLHLGLLASGVGPGDEIIVPSFTFAATANSVALTGATPVFVDIEPEHFTLDPISVEAAITPRTVGIMPVHLYGHPANLRLLSEIATRHGIHLFEDAAQAHGATFEGRPVGSFGTFGMFSFYPTKNMTAGEGGIVVTSDALIERKLRLLRNQGMERRYENELVGFNARMTDLHAAIGRVQTRKVRSWTQRRQTNAHYLSNRIVGVKTPSVADNSTHVFHQFTIRVENDRDGFAAALRAEYAIGSGVYYPVPVHRLPAFSHSIDLPETERACGEVLSLPVHPSLTEQCLDRIIFAVNQLARAGG